MKFVYSLTHRWFFWRYKNTLKALEKNQIWILSCPSVIRTTFGQLIDADLKEQRSNLERRLCAYDHTPKETV
jgi:hypothetical protein